MQVLLDMVQFFFKFQLLLFWSRPFSFFVVSCFFKWYDLPFIRCFWRRRCSSVFDFIFRLPVPTSNRFGCCHLNLNDSIPGGFFQGRQNIQLIELDLQGGFIFDKFSNFRQNSTNMHLALYEIRKYHVSVEIAGVLRGFLAVDFIDNP